MSGVAIIGAGLIGGSIARDLAARGVRVLVHDRDPDASAAAVADGVAALALDASLAGIETATTIVLAVPVGQDVAVLERIATRAAADTLILDTASVLVPAVTAALRLGLGDRFIGSHPLAGDHRSGWSAARRGLFDGAKVYLCPTAATTAERLTDARAFWSALGATPHELGPTAHDHLLAWSSHLPQAVSSALGLALARAGIPHHALGPGGRDVTRLAASTPDVWTPILLANADAVAHALEAAGGAVAELRDAVMSGDSARIATLLGEAVRWSTNRTGSGR